MCAVHNVDIVNILRRINRRDPLLPEADREIAKAAGLAATTILGGTVLTDQGKLLLKAQPRPPLEIVGTVLTAEQKRVARRRTPNPQ